MSAVASGITLREAAPADAQALAVFGMRTYASHYADYWSPAALRDYLERNYAPDRIAAELAAHDRVRYVLAEEDGRIVGFAKLVRNRAVPTQSGERGAELEKIYVAAGRTGQGIGSKLVAHCAWLAERLGERVLWLDVLRSNFSGRRLYERQGFRVCGELPFATDLRSVGMWVMTRELSANAAA